MITNMMIFILGRLVLVSSQIMYQSLNADPRGDDYLLSCIRNKGKDNNLNERFVCK